jgi:hypothetical protein
MATNSSNIVSVSNKGNQSVEEMLAELKALREQNAALAAANVRAAKEVQVFVDPKGTGRIVVTGCGRGGRTYITPKASDILYREEIVQAVRKARADHPELVAQHAAFAATFADKE